MSSTIFGGKKKAAPTVEPAGPAIKQLNAPTASFFDPRRKRASGPVSAVPTILSDKLGQ